MVEFEQAHSNSLGEVTVTVSASRDGAARFGYLGALEIEGL